MALKPDTLANVLTSGAAILAFLNDLFGLCAVILGLLAGYYALKTNKLAYKNLKEKKRMIDDEKN